MIAKERSEHFTKHKFTTEYDAKVNANRQLEAAAIGLLYGSEEIFPWTKEIFVRMTRKSKIEMLAIAGSLLAAEIDRLLDAQGHVIVPPGLEEWNESRPSSISAEAEEIVGGQRAIDYGDMTKSFTDIGKVWSVLAGVEISAHKVGLMMAGLKLVRENNSPKRDNLVDLAGYAYCTQQIVDRLNTETHEQK